MKFWKFLILLLPFTFYLLPTTVHAANEFSVDATVTYDVQSSGKTLVSHNINLVNNSSDLYATTYSLSLENIDANNIRSFSDKTSYTINSQKNGDITTIKVTFPDAVVGKGAQRNFIISYENNSFAVKTGEIWEVTVPRLGNNSSFRNYQVLLKIPTSFGLEAYISPSPKNSQKVDSGYIYTFDKNSITTTGITAGFGAFQVFSFNLHYHLDSGQSLNGFPPNEIAIPPDTAYQKVYIQSVSPAPQSVTVDADGNWIAKFDLTHTPRLDVTVSGAAQIFASFRSFPKPTDQELENNLKETQFWQTTDPQIMALAAELKTPEAIYNYVSTTLKYDSSRATLPGVQRMGATWALQNPTHAICMEYTDLFVAIARAAGIPAREINGYAYAENPDLEPLSLVADVLHAWPEYYDKTKGVWIPVDPTWGSTTGGVDYFSKLDLRHFAFVIHGENDIIPSPPGSYKLGNPQKDVYVSFGKLPEQRISVPNIAISAVRTLPFLSSLYNIIIKNPGPEALYSLTPQVLFDGKVVGTNFIDILPPYSNYHMPLSVPFSILGKTTPNVVGVEIGNASAQITTNKDQIVINSLLIISVVLIILIIVILFLLKKITFNKLFGTIAWIFKKKHDRSITKPPQTGGNTPTI